MNKFERWANECQEPRFFAYVIAGLIAFAYVGGVVLDKLVEQGIIQ